MGLAIKFLIKELYDYILLKLFAIHEVQSILAINSPFLERAVFFE